MRRFIYSLWLCSLLGLAAFAADELPQPKKDTTPPEPLPRLAPTPGGGDFSRAQPGELQKLLDQLRRDIGTLRNERKEPQPPGASGESPEEEAARLWKRYEDLWKRLATRETKPAPPSSVDKPRIPDTLPPTAPVPPSKPPTPAANVGLIDPVALAQNLFRTGDFAGALDAYRKAEEAFTRQAEGGLGAGVDPAGPEDRVPVKYMIATCLRRLGKTSEAEVIYREVASSRGDEFVAECARWQLTLLTWKKQTEADLAALRQRNKNARAAIKALEDRP